MKVVSAREARPVEPHEVGDGAEARSRPVYQPPRIVKKRPVSRATLFTGSGPDTGGVVG